MTNPTRRDVLYVGLLGGLGLTLGDYFRLRADEPAKPAKEPRAKSVIHIYLNGGFAHMDSFDPKPDSPAEYRGELGSIETALPGVRFHSHMKETAKVADKLSVCRSMTHTEVDHGRGQHSMFTGYRPSPAIVYPSVGSVIAQRYGPRRDLPPYICVPSMPNFGGSGYLSSAYGPFAVGSDPGRGFGGGSQLTVRDVALPAGVDDERFQRRRDILSLVDGHFSSLEKADTLDAMDTFYQQAYGMLSSDTARQAFNIAAEPKKVREEYGTRGAGPRFLMARRLVEAGARFVTAVYGAWDTHSYHYRNIELQMPDFDRAYAALIRDLDQRGLLDSTLVVTTTEFGRTPKLNSGAGRDHWPRVFSVVMAGGGIKRGQTYGSSDALASDPKDNPLSIEDFNTTIYSLLGIDAKKDLMAPGNRPLQIVQNGKVVRELLA